MKRVKFDIGEFVNTTTELSVKYKIAENFKARRKESKLSQNELAKKSGVSFSSIRRFEKYGEISLSSLLKLASVIDSLNEFVQLFSTPIIKNLKDL